MTKQVRQSRNVFDIETARPTGADLERLRAMALVRFSDETMDDLMKDLNQDFRTRKQSIKSHKTYKDATKNEKIDALKSEYREKKEVIEATDLDRHNAKRLEDRVDEWLKISQLKNYRGGVIVCICAKATYLSGKVRRFGQATMGAPPEDVEAELIQDFFDWSAEGGPVKLLGGANIKFDINFLRMRCIARGIVVPEVFLDRWNRADPFIDLETNKVNRDELLALVGMGHDIGQETGAEIQGMVDRNEWDKIIEKCTNDVDTTDELLQYIT